MGTASINSLKVFVRVVESGSFSSAGRELGMSQPAVSNHLHALEERYGLSLVSRGRPMRPTPAGECLMRHASKVLRQMEDLEKEMTRQATPRGPLTIGVSTTPAEVLIPRQATCFSRRYPEVSLSVEVHDSAEVLRRLLDREIEVAVIGGGVSDERVEARVVEEDRLTLIASAGEEIESVISPEELGRRPFVLREPGSATRKAVEETLAEAGITPSVAMEMGSNAAVVASVAEGVGVGVVPERVIGESLEVQRLEIPGLEFLRSFVLATERGRSLSPAALAFIEVCVENRK